MASAHWWRRYRWVIVVATFALVTATLTFLLNPPGSREALHPGSATPEGARAVAQVASDHGMTIRRVTRFDDVHAELNNNTPVTVVVSRSDLMAPGRARDLADTTRQVGADVVLVGADNAVLTDFDLPLGASLSPETALRQPNCAAAGPNRAGATHTGSGYSYLPVGQGNAQRIHTCYLDGDSATYVSIEEPSQSPNKAKNQARRIVLFGDGTPLQNQNIDQDGNAALVLDAIGRHPVAIWWTPNPIDGASSAAPSFWSLVPNEVKFMALQLSAAALLVILWRSRRLGRLVTEPLPVTVRALETTHGRAQLYRKAQARGRAARILRTATTRRLAQPCGLPVTTAAETIALAVSRITGRSSADVVHLLTGPDPEDDPQLVMLARSLHSLEEEVRHQ
ncbi:MAG: DUF4350 domain-containing protein [Actinomycetota bacterium]